MNHFARLGGVLLHPRQTLLRMLHQEDGRLWELVPWVLLTCAAASPTQAGRALLLMRVDLFAGLSSLISMVSYRMGNGLIGALVAAGILYMLHPRKDDEGIHFDRALDAAFFMLVPFLLLTVVGTLLTLFGMELWFMPHRRLRGYGWILAVRIAVAYGWSIIIFGVVAYSVWRDRVAAQGSSISTGSKI